MSSLLCQLYQTVLRGRLQHKLLSQRCNKWYLRHQPMRRARCLPVYFCTVMRVTCTWWQRIATGWPEKRLSPTKKDVALLVPASAMQDLLRIIGDHEEDVEVTHDDQQVLFQVGDIELVTRQIEGSYPDYRKLIPKTFETTANLKTSDLASVTKVASLFARESAGSITITADEDTKEMSIKSIASQLGENTSSAPATVKGGGSITLNSRYLIDGLGALTGPEVEFCFNGKLDPAILKSAKQDDYLHVIMPLKS
jgi:DNA polymerase III subunit beta